MNDLPVPVKKRPRKTLITAGQAAKAAEACGLTVAVVGNLLSSARLGKYIEQLGAIPISRTKMLVAAHKAEEVIAKCDALIAQNDGDLPLQIDLTKLKAIYLDIFLKAVQGQMKAPREPAAETSSAAPLVMAFPPGTEIAARVPETSKKTE